jgi:hypothetical protein
VTFDEVVPRLLSLCSESAIAHAITTWGVIRDLRGCVRLVVEPVANAAVPEQDRRTLEANLVAALGAYFAGPLLATTDAREAGRFARTLLDRASAWTDAEYLESTTGITRRAPGQWRRFDSRLSKIDWLESPGIRPPWPLRAERPAVVTFYSYKGGVGRTTALCSYAWQLAREGKRVAVVDLDLEAPGLGSLVGTETQRGVIDFIVDHVATAGEDLTGLAGPALAFGALSERVQAFPAGRVDRSYLDKLARLDFAVTAFTDPPGQRSPTASALAALVRRIAQQDPRPQAILIDSRAGLHDLAGLSLHGLAHVDVLLSRAGEQSYRGLELALSVLASRKLESLACVLVQAMALRKGQPGADEEAAEFRARSYEIFRNHVYTEASGYDAESVPALDSIVDPHTPYPLYFNNDLLRFTDLADRQQDLFAEDYSLMKARIEELSQPEEPEDAP